MLARAIWILLNFSAAFAHPPIDCGEPGLSGLTSGEFVIKAIEKFSVECRVQIEKPDLKIIDAPGCILIVERVSSPPNGLNAERGLKIYAEGRDCNLKSGSQVKRSFAARCCVDPAFTLCSEAAEVGFGCMKDQDSWQVITDSSFKKFIGAAQRVLRQEQKNLINSSESQTPIIRNSTSPQ